MGQGPDPNLCGEHIKESWTAIQGCQNEFHDQTSAAEFCTWSPVVFGIRLKNGLITHNLAPQLATIYKYILQPSQGLSIVV